MDTSIDAGFVGNINVGSVEIKHITLPALQLPAVLTWLYQDIQSIAGNKLFAHLFYQVSQLKFSFDIILRNIMNHIYMHRSSGEE